MSPCGEDISWEDNDGNIIHIGGRIWLCLPGDNVAIGDKIDIENPDNAILCSKRLIADSDYRLKTLPFESLSVVYEGVTDNTITCSFKGEVFLDCINDPTTVEIVYGKIQVYRGGKRNNLTYESWLRFNREDLYWE